jgi:GMP synthase-like glutamine amidotransferase
MPKTLLVNCYLDSIKILPLREAIGKFSSNIVVNFEKIGLDYQLSSDIGSIVVSGSEARIVKPEDRAKFEGVMALIRASKLPIFGICFGHQLLCSAFGAKTGSLKQPVIDRFEQVNVIHSGDILAMFKQDKTIPLAQWHNDYVLKESLNEAGFNLLANSASCEVEAVKHRTNHFYGVQFHPERITIKGETHPEGHRVIENFYVHTVMRLGL